MIDKATLKIIGDTIRKIENKNDNYQNDETWIKLRKIQDDAFKEFAMQEIKLSKTKYANRVDKEYIDKINTYINYLESIGNGEYDEYDKYFNRNDNER